MRWRVLPLAFVCVACGSGVPLDFDEAVPTQLRPIVTRVAPAAARAGDAVTIFGMGFTAEPAQNTILVGGATTVATGYALVSPPAAGEIEQLTFTVPTTATVGATTVSVFVFENGSNHDIAFTVTP